MRLIFMKSFTLSLVFLAATLTAPLAWAENGGIEGTVKDVNGKALKGADIRIEAKDGSSWHKLAKSDGNGHYAYVGLSDGTYRVSLLVSGATKASINNVKIKSGGSTNLNFDLQKNAAPAQAVASAKRKTHKVWFPAQTGSNLGGRWVEVNDAGDTSMGASGVTKASGGVLNAVQSNSSNHSTGGN
jgi:Carboxypeptidase regulatory-like domain